MARDTYSMNQEYVAVVLHPETGRQCRGTIPAAYFRHRHYWWRKSKTTSITREEYLRHAG